MSTKNQRKDAKNSWANETNDSIREVFELFSMWIVVKVMSTIRATNEREILTIEDETKMSISRDDDVDVDWIDNERRDECRRRDDWTNESEESE